MQYTSLCGDQHLLRQSLGGYFTQGNPPPLKIFSHICPLSMCVCMYVWVGVFHRIICENIADSKTLKYFLSYLLRTRIFLQRTTRPSSHLEIEYRHNVIYYRVPFQTSSTVPRNVLYVFSWFRIYSLQFVVMYLWTAVISESLPVFFAFMTLTFLRVQARCLIECLSVEICLIGCLWLDSG